MWWFKRAVLRPTFADVQAMHPWFLDYEQLEPGVRELVRTLNQTDLVETLSSCEGHPEFPDWWEATGGTAYVLCLVTCPTGWDSVLHRLQAAGSRLEQGPIDGTGCPGPFGAGRAIGKVGTVRAVAGVSSQL